MERDLVKTIERSRDRQVEGVEARSQRAGFRSVESIVAELLERCERRMGRLRDDGTAWPVAQASFDPLAGKFARPASGSGGRG